MSKSIATALTAVFLLLITAEDVSASRTLSAAYLKQGKEASDKGQLSQSLQLFNAALEEHGQSSYDSELAAIYNNIGDVERRLGELEKANSGGDGSGSQEWFERAEGHLKQSLEIKEQLYGSDSLIVARTLDNLANLYQARGNLAQAESIYRKALETRTFKQGADHPDTADEYFGLGEICKDTERLPEAKRNLSKALALWTKSIGPNNLATARCKDRLGVCDQLVGNYNQAYSYYCSAWSVYRTKFPASNPERRGLEANMSYVAGQLASDAVQLVQNKAAKKGYDMDIVSELRRAVELLKRANRQDEYAAWNAELQRILVCEKAPPASKPAAKNQTKRKK